jgi:PKD repeat protein
MKTKLIAFIGVGKVAAASAVVAALLLGAATAQAAELKTDGDVATAITNLTIGSNTYDVKFILERSDIIYGDPPTFEAKSNAEAKEAVGAVIAVLNSDGGIKAVGESANRASIIFRVPWDLVDVPVPLTDTTLPTLNVWEGVTGDGEESGDWVRPGDPDAFPWRDDGMFAEFTLQNGGGQGNSPPAADSGGPYEGAVGVAVQFDGSGSSDREGSITSYQWDFGDGSALVKGKKKEHVYQKADKYNVILKVKDEAGVKASEKTSADIGEQSKKPVADAGGSYEGSVDSNVEFDGSGSSDKDGEIDKYKWDFGDGKTAQGKTPDHKYEESGKYTATLTVTDDSGDKDSDTANVTIGTGNLPPKANAGGGYNGEVDDQVEFDGSASSDPDGEIKKYNWDFGDGKSDSGKMPDHKYDEAGTYTVTLEVKDDDGAWGSDSTTTVIVN